VAKVADVRCGTIDSCCCCY